MKRSIILGAVLDSISEFSISNHEILTAKYQVITDKNTLQIITFTAVQKNFLSHIDIAKEIPFIGLKRGAISMAQIITATEFCNNQRAAITHDKNISIRYNLSGIESSFTFIATFALFSQVNSKKSILSKKVLILSVREILYLLIFSLIFVFHPQEVSRFISLVFLESSIQFY